MGILDKIASVLGPGPKTFNILVVGLDNSGKSALIASLKADGAKNSGDILPTVGVKMEKIKLKNCLLQIHDMSGQGKYRAMWERCFSDCDAIVFVIDSSDRVRVAVAKDEFEGLMEHATLKERTHIPFLIVANKKYQEGAIPSNTIAQLLELERHLVGRPWHLQATDVVAGEGVIEGFTWLKDFLVSAPIRVTS